MARDLGAAKRVPTNSTVANLLILGFGGHARSVADVALAAGYKRLLFLDKNARNGETFAGYPAVRKIDVLEGNWVSFSASGDSYQREQHYRNASLPLILLISPRAQRGIESEIGMGTFVAHGAHVGPGTRVGSSVILNTGSIVEHECDIGDFSHISVNATVAGRCRVGRHVMIGAGATVIDGVTITDGVVIGAGSVVISDILEQGTYVGIPARRIK